MKTHRVGIIMNGVTGRMGTNQHLIRSLCAINEQGGLKASAEDLIVAEPILVGRNPEKLKALCARTGTEKWSTDVDAVLSDSAYSVYFDAQTTQRRFDTVKKAIAAGKHIYCEKPAAVTSAEAVELYQLARKANLKNGVVQDKLWLPGLLKLKRLLDSDFFGRLLSVRIEFGYWVFPGHVVESQRPSWNYRKAEGGGIILDMICHFSYVMESLFGAVKSVSCLAATHVPERVDENGKPYESTAEDAAYATFELDGGTVAHVNASWCTHVRRDDLLTVHVDGMNGAAVAGLRKCRAQHVGSTPRIVWNPDVESPLNYYDGWTEVPDSQIYDNAFKAQWELYLKHLILDEPFRWTLLEGAKNVLLAEKATESWQQRKCLDVPTLTE